MQTQAGIISPSQAKVIVKTPYSTFDAETKQQTKDNKEKYSYFSDEVGTDFNIILNSSIKIPIKVFSYEN